MNRTLLLALPALVILAVPAARAQTPIIGHHDNNPTPPSNGDGFDAASGSFIVAPDTGTDADATFSNNQTNGLKVGVDGTTSASASVLVNGGTFSGNYVGIRSTDGGAVSVTGGIFSGNFIDFLALSISSNQAVPGTIDIYGSFINPTTNQPLLPGDTLTFGPFSGGTFTGTLASNTVAQSYRYNDYRGVITLHDVALVPAPEPSQFATFAIGLLGLGLLTVKARRHIALRQCSGVGFSPRV